MVRPRPQANVWCLTLLCLAISACAVPSALRHSNTRRHLRDHQQIWSSAQLDAYRFTVQVQCFCDAELVTGATIEVRNGTPTVVPDPTGARPRNTQPFVPFDSVEDPFQVIDAAIARNDEVIAVQYDTQHGYPADIVLDGSSRTIDDEVHVVIRDFAVIP